MYSTNTVPETEVRGTLWLILAKPKAWSHKVPLTSVSGTVLVEYHHVTMIHMLYTIVCRCAIIVFTVLGQFLGHFLKCICVLVSSSLVYHMKTIS